MSIRTAILGYGRSGSTLHANPIEKNNAFDLVAVCDIDTERQTHARQRFHCAVYDDYHHMLKSETLDLVVIVTRSDQHCEMTCDCLEAGKAVLVTKPWAVNAGEAQKMVQTARDTKSPLLPWLPARWGADLRTLRKIVVDERAIGNAFLIRRNVSSFGTRNDWQTQKRFGGGYLLNWGPHIVDPPVLLTGSKPVSVYGRMKQTINPGDVEDLFLGIITIADGTIVQVEYTIAVQALPEWYIQGDQGTIVVNEGTVTVFPQTPVKPDDPTKYKALAAEEREPIVYRIDGAQYGDEDEIYQDIADSINGTRAYPVKPDDALALSELLDGIRTSSETNRVVQLAIPD